MSQRQCDFNSTTYTQTSAGQALYRMIGYTDKKDISLTDVMGYTSWAFRINIHARTVNIAGPYASLSWGDVFRQGMMNLGFTCKSIGEPNLTPPTPRQLQEALLFVQSSIDTGIPVMAWDLFVPEFGIIYGYDDSQQLLNCKDTAEDGLLPYHKLGRGRIGELFVLGVTDTFEVDEIAALRGALDMVLDHAFNHLPRHDEEPYRNGLAGYEAWIQAFRSGSVEVVGNAYNALVVSDAREYAYRFLAGLSEKNFNELPVTQEISRLALAAAEHYREVARHLAEIRTLFPFPQGGTPNDPETAGMAITLLEQALAAEERGIQQLQVMHRVLEQYIS